MLLGSEGVAKAQGCVWLEFQGLEAGPSDLVSTRSTCVSLVGIQEASGMIHCVTTKRGTMCSGVMALPVLTRSPAAEKTPEVF